MLVSTRMVPSASRYTLFILEPALTDEVIPEFHRVMVIPQLEVSVVAKYEDPEKTVVSPPDAAGDVGVSYEKGLPTMEATDT